MHIFVIIINLYVDNVDKYMHRNIPELLVFILKVNVIFMAIRPFAQSFNMPI